MCSSASQQIASFFYCSDGFVHRSRVEHTPDPSLFIQAPTTYIRAHCLRGSMGTGPIDPGALASRWELPCCRFSIGFGSDRSDSHRLGTDCSTPKAQRNIAAASDDESWVGGFVSSYSTEVEETGDREIVLSAPIRFRAKGQTEASVLPNVSAFVVSANHIVGMQVSLLPVADWQPLCGLARRLHGARTRIRRCRASRVGPAQAWGPPARSAESPSQGLGASPAPR